MQLNAFAINDDQNLESIACDSLSVDWVEDPISRWVEIEESDPDKLQTLIEPLQLHPLIAEACVRPENRPRVIVVEDVILIEYPIDSADSEATSQFLRIVALPTLLISIVSIPVAAITTLADQLRGHIGLVGASTDALLYQLLDYLLDASRPRIFAIRREVNAAASSMMVDPFSVESSQINRLHDRIRQTRVNVEEQLYCMEMMQSAQLKALKAAHMAEYFQDLLAALQNLQRTVEGTEQAIRDLHQMHFLAHEETTSKRLRVLSVLSAIYLPATLIAAIYGMNFDNIPITKVPFGYFLVLAIMVVVAIGQIAYFHKRGWFK